MPHYPEQARETLQREVYERAFFEKLSRDWNIVPRSQAERRQLLEVAFNLKAAKAADQEKQASTGNPFLSAALDGLRSALRQEGVDTRQDGYDVVKEAAFNLTQQSDIAHAGLAIAEYLAAENA